LVIKVPLFSPVGAGDTPIQTKWAKLVILVEDDPMRYVDHGGGGAADCMRILEGTRPKPAAGQILIEVAFAGVNRPDVLQRSGRYPPPIDASPLLGLEVSGTIVEIGSGVTQWSVGDQVTSLVPGGGYAEYCVAPAAHALPIPSNLDLAGAAALPEVWYTVWGNLVGLGRLRAGERLLIHGGASGIGLCAIQLAKHLGVECIVTVGSDEKAKFCVEFGAKHAINYQTEDFANKVLALTQNQGVDVVLDMVGAPYFQRNLGVLRRDGRLISIAFLQGSKGEFDLLPVMVKRLTLTGSTMRARSIAEKAALRDALLTNIWPELANGGLAPHICATFPLKDVVEAHQLMESSRHIGKIVLRVKSG
jgi:NADPH:quinone reductase